MKLRRRQRTRTSPVAPGDRQRERRRKQPGGDVTDSENKNKQVPKRPGWLSRVGAVVLSLVVLAAAINLLTLSSQASISIINSDGESSPQTLQDEAIYQQAASELFAASVWNRNKITVDTGSVQKQMEKKFPELTSISITIPWLTHRPVVHIQPATPALVLAKSSEAWLLDDQGRVLAKAVNRAALGVSDELPSVTDQSGLQADLGDQVVPARHIRFMNTVIDQLAARQYTVAELILPSSSSQLDVRLANEPYIVKFNLQNDSAREQAGTFLATIARLKKDRAVPGQYIDVRVPGRAYYQ